MKREHSETTRPQDYKLIFDLPLTSNATERISGVTGVQNLTSSLTFSQDKGAYGVMGGGQIGKYWLAFNMSNTDFQTEISTCTEIIVELESYCENMPSDHTYALSYLVSIKSSNSYSASNLIVTEAVSKVNTGHTNVDNRKINKNEWYTSHEHFVYDINNGMMYFEGKTSNNNNFDTYSKSTSIFPSSSWQYIYLCPCNYGNNTWYSGYIKNVKIYIK